MCSRPRAPNEELLYIRVSQIPSSLCSDDLRLLFSKFGLIEHLEYHRSGEHCYIGYKHLAHAVYAFKQGGSRGGYQFSITVVWDWPLLDPVDWVFSTTQYLNSLS